MCEPVLERVPRARTLVMTARRCKAGDLFAKPLALPVPVVASGLDGKMCSTPAGILGWLHDTRISCGRSMYRHRDPGSSTARLAFPILLWSAPMSCDAMRCAAPRCAARKERGRKEANVWQTKGPNVPLQPWSCERRRRSSAGVSGTVCRIGGGRASVRIRNIGVDRFASFQKNVPQRWKLKSGQVEARDHYGSATSRILRGRLRRPGASSPMDSQPV